MDDLVADIRWQADIEGQTYRYTVAQLERLANESIRRLRRELFALGSKTVLKTIEAAHGGSTGATSGWPGTILDLSSATGNALAGVKNLRVSVNSKWLNVPEHPVEGVTDWQLPYHGVAATGAPEAYALVGLDAESAASAMTGSELQILVLPALDQAYTFQLTYLPEWPELTTALGNNTYQIHNDVPGLDWVLWDCVERIKVRDKLSDEAQIAAGKRLEEWEKIKTQQRRLSRAGPIQRRPVQKPVPSNLWRWWL
jgi:hypothetical protein